MNKFNKMTVRLIAITQIFAITLLAACSNVAIPTLATPTLGATPLGTPALDATADTTTLSKICHATGDPANPYEETTVTNTELNDHLGHPNDIIPALATGCPASPAIISDGKITICHATDSTTNPYEKITVSVNGLNGHNQHAGDIFPLSDGTCPKSLVVTDNKDKITICHATNSSKNPYIEITISVNGLNGHNQHAGDIIPAPAGGCPRTGGNNGGNNGNGNGNGNNGNGNGNSGGNNGNGNSNGGGSHTP